MIGYNGIAKTGFENLRVYQLAEEITDLGKKPTDNGQ
jgi:hypothetical protein